MTDMIVIYITCDSVDQAKKIGKHLLEKRLGTCINVFPKMEPMYWWPPHENKLEEGPEVVLLVKTLDKKFDEIEKEVKKVHTYETVCVFAIPIAHVSKEYYEWIKGEIR